MTLTGTMSGLLRRWYIVVPGLILAVALGVVALQSISPTFERSAWVLLVPGRGTIPEDSSNPYLHLGGLSPAADVVVRSVGSQEVMNDVSNAHPGIDVKVGRDPTTSAPVIQFTVVAQADEETGQVLDVMINRTSQTLDQIQNEQEVRPQDRITVTTLARDATGSPRQRTRLVGAVGTAGLVVLLTLVVASASDGLLRGMRGGRKRHGGCRVN